MPNSLPKRFDDVWFRFVLGSKEDTSLKGQVLVSAGEMKIDVKGPYGRYLIAGRAVKHWFEGVNARGPEHPNVHAEWAQVGNIYLGSWVEEGTKYLFTFKL